MLNVALRTEDIHVRYDSGRHNGFSNQFFLPGIREAIKRNRNVRHHLIPWE